VSKRRRHNPAQLSLFAEVERGLPRRPGQRCRPKVRFFETDQDRREALAEMVRGTLIARCDTVAERMMRAAEDRYGVPPSKFLTFYGDMLALLFPESFLDVPQEPGIIPRNGGDKLTLDHWQAFAEALGA
jgi:hypothetical protein